MPHGQLHERHQISRLCNIDVAQTVTDNDIQAIENVIDDLLAIENAAEDPYSLCIHDYLAVLQPLQLALEYTWALYSQSKATQDVAARCLTAASSFRSALQRYAKAAQAEEQQLSQDTHASVTQSEQLRSQLRPLKKLHAATRVELKAQEVQNQQSQIVLRSRKTAIDWDALRGVEADVEGVQCVYGIVHILAYGDITQQPWQDLRAADCLHFIQLAQCALEYMLQQATTVHTALETTQQQLHKQEAAIKRLHQRCRECFCQLRLGRAAACPSAQPDISLQEVNIAAQSGVSAAKEQSADGQSAGPMQEPQREQQREAELPARVVQGRQERPVSPVKGSQVHYRSSSDAPVLVQGRSGAVAAEQAGNDVDWDKQVQDRIGVSNTQRPDLLQGPDAVTQDLEASLRHEEQQLHEARSQVADLWAVIAAADQPAILPSAEDAVPSVPELEWTTDMPTTPHQAQTSITHTTSLNVDLEALRAAERRHAEAQLRAVFADIKQKAFVDITQRMTRSTDERAKSRWQGAASSEALLATHSIGDTPKPASQLNGKQLMQHFSSAAPVSHMVKHLQGSTSLHRLSSSSSQAHFTGRRPPKARLFGVQPMSQSSNGAMQLQSNAGQADVRKTAQGTRQAHLSPHKLMRLTSCIKLNKV